MSLKGQLFLFITFGILVFLCFRQFMSELKSYLLNESALKKRDKKETPIEWLLYSNFKDVFPVGFLIAYYVFLGARIFLLLLLLALCLLLPQLFQSVGGCIAIFPCYFESAVFIIVRLLLCFPDRDFHFERWIKKK